MTYSKAAWFLSSKRGLVTGEKLIFCPQLLSYLHTGWITYEYANISSPSKYLIPLEYTE